MTEEIKRVATSDGEAIETAKAVASVSLKEEEKADSRTSYYDRWSKLTKEELAKAEEEDKIETEKANRKLGINPEAPKSEAEKKDKEKHEYLKEAKKRWDEKKLKEDMMKHLIEEIHDQEIVLDSDYLKKKPVLFVKSSKRSTFKLPSNLGHRIVKVFVHNCEDCVFDFETETITQHTEFAFCKNIEVNVRAPLTTLQVDMSEEVKVAYGKNMFTIETKIFHAGVKNMHVETDDGHSHKADYIRDGAVAVGQSTPEEQQFVTKIHSKTDKLHTERVIRTKGDLPLGESEILKAKGTEAEISATPQTRERQAELKKQAGNEAFCNQEYAQAAVFYTEAIALCDEESDIVHKCYSNRAFCFQKLGQHEKAEADARKCVELKPDYAKGHFRLGLALHAMGKYFEALPVLSKALELEPKNATIKQALGFSEIKARKLTQH